MTTGAKRIMVIEDEPTVKEFCHRVLSEAGFTVDTAVQGRSARSMIQKQNYDLLIIDLRMPVMNGQDFYRYLTDTNPRLARRVIFTTGDVICPQTRHFIQHCHQPFLLKPFTPDELRGIVHQTLRRTGK